MIFRKESGAIDMVSLILTVVIPAKCQNNNKSLFNDITGTSAAVTMMVGLELDKCKNFLTGNRGCKHAEQHASNYLVGTFPVTYERFDKHRDRIYEV